MNVEIMDSAGNWNNLTPYIAYQGWKVSRNDIDGPNAGRNIRGTMIRDRVTTKARIDVTCVPLKKTMLDILNYWLSPVQFYIRYKDDGGDWVVMLVYSNNYSWQYYQKMPSGTEVYFGITFPLIEI